MQNINLHCDDILDVVVSQRIENYNLINAIQKLRSEMLFKLFQNLIFFLFESFRGATQLIGIQMETDRTGLLRKLLGSDIGCHDDNRIFEINFPSLAIGQNAIFQNLQ